MGGPSMPYRGMTETELHTFVQEFRAFETWREYVSFARDIYGPHAERIEVVTTAERNGAGSYAVIDAIYVYDAQRRPLEPALSTPWWQRAFRESFPDDELYDDDLHEDWIDAMMGERQAALPVPAGGFDMFLVSRPPRRRHTTLFVEERAFASA